MLYPVLALSVIAALALGRLVLTVVRFVKVGPAGRRNWLRARWVAVRWRWLCRNLGLAYLDQHRKAVGVSFGTSVKVRSASPKAARLRYPRARFRPDAFGVVAKVHTVPKTGRAEFEDAAAHIANAWRCIRVQVSQPKPGRLIVRGLRTDPLTLPLPVASAPPGVYGSTSVQTPLRWLLGRDEWGDWRSRDLVGLTGITVGGLPGYGKTSLINSLLMQLAGLPVAFVFIDGKGGGDYTDWHDRAWIYTGDELAAAAATLEDVHALMRSRFGTVLEDTGHRNAWHTGPTSAFPLVVIVIDECHSFYDLEAVKGDHQAEKHVRACRALTGQLVRKGRSVLMLTILITQKQTGDAIPTAIRDNCGLGLSFAVKTRDAAVAALGEAIRDHSSYCPTGLQDPAYVGVTTASLRTGHDPFVRIRVPHISEEAARERARATARIDPTSQPAAPVVPVLEPVTA